MKSSLRLCDPTILLSIIERFTSIGEAEAAVTALDAAAIEVTLFDDQVVAIDWLYSNAVGGIKVIVREEDYDAAADVLDLPAEETQEAGGEAPDEPDDEDLEETAQPQCPSCGLTAIKTIPKFRVFAILVVLLLAVGRIVNQFGLAAVAILVLTIALAITPSNFCADCGEKFSLLRRRPDIDEGPLPQDLLFEHCPRCGSTEFYRVYHRRLKALGMFQLLVLVVVVLWPFVPKWACDACGYKSLSIRF